MYSVRITEITPQQFWANGYRWGYRDGERGLPHLLDDEPRVNGAADVIELRRRDAAVAAEG